MRVASAGFWHVHGTDYAEDARNHPDVQLVAVWDSDARRGQDGARKHAVPFVPDLQTILDDDTIDGVMVCTATAEHLEVVTRCIEAGKHVFVEKVLSATLAEARTIVDAARRSDITLAVSLWRADKGYTAQITDLVAAGAVGRVTSARVRDGHPFSLPMDGYPDGLLPERFYASSDTKGGALIDLCHPVYLLAKIVGTPASVSTALGYVTGRDVEDNAMTVMSYPGGALGIAETSYVTRITPFTIEVHGTEGSLIYTEPGIGEKIRTVDAVADSDGHPVGPVLHSWSTARSDAGWVAERIRSDQPRAFDQWVHNAQNGVRDDANLDLALALSAIVEAAYTSAAQSRAVAVESV